MQGFQITFFTLQDRRHRHQPVHEWLLELARSLGIGGATAFAGAEGFGRHGRFHSAHFFELADQPVEVTLAATAQQAAALFVALEQSGEALFYVKTPVEFGTTGLPDPDPAP